MDTSKFVSFDLETYLATSGRAVPKIVCGSVATTAGSMLLHNDRHAIETARQTLESGQVLVGANIAAFDLVCLVSEDETMFPVVWRALREGRIFDVLIVQALDAIAGGHHGLDPRTASPIVNAEGKATSRYSLYSVVDMVLGRKDAKDKDAFRLSYGLLHGVPADRWPAEAQKYPIDDAVNTLEVALKQMSGWIRGRMDSCTGPARNIGNLAAQCEAAFSFALGAAWGMRTSKDAVAALAKEVGEKHRVATERFRKLGWVREDGTEDQGAVKRAVAEAFGASGKCSKCGGTGKIVPIDYQTCRGEKLRGRYQGCLGQTCATCGGLAVIGKPGAPTTCKAQDGGCDGTGFDLSTAKMLTRTDKGGIKTDRDTLAESGSDDLAEYGEDEFEKVRTTYVPYLWQGVDKPINFRPNALVVSGRCSYDTIHQFPRARGPRECFCARPGCVLCSTDYASGELCTLGQYCKWTVGYSRMVEIINKTRDPGALHTFLASKMIGTSFEEAVARVKAGDKVMKNFRQSAKPANFGFGGGMGSVLLVLTSRKKNAGTTQLPNGHKVPGIRFCVLVGGKERCGVEKIMQWKDRPCPPVCKACVKIVDEIVRPAFFDAYPEVKDYHKVVSQRHEAGLPALCLAWDREKGKAVVIRERGRCGYSEMANNGFQALLADIGKRAFSRMTREGYLGVKDDGSPSVLAGVRFPAFVHDEPLAEMREEIAHLAGPRIAEIMVECGREMAPDVFWKAEPALGRIWSKEMEPVYDGSGKLTLWEPKG